MSSPPRKRLSGNRRWLDRHRASFETAALRPPQDEDFLNASRSLPHAEERPQGASRSTHYLTTAGLANLLTAAKAGVQGLRSDLGSLDSRFRGNDGLCLGAHENFRSELRLDRKQAAEKMQEHRHSGARAVPASPESRNTDQRSEWLGQCSWFPGPALTGRPGMTREFFSSLLKRSSLARLREARPPLPKASSAEVIVMSVLTLSYIISHRRASSFSAFWSSPHNKKRHRCNGVRNFSGSEELEGHRAIGSTARPKGVAERIGTQQRGHCFAPIRTFTLYSPQTSARRPSQFSPITLRIFASGQPACSIAAVKLGKSPMVRIPAGFNTSPSGPVTRHPYPLS